MFDHTSLLICKQLSTAHYTSFNLDVITYWLHKHSNQLLFNQFQCAIILYLYIVFHVQSHMCCCMYNQMVTIFGWCVMRYWATFQSILTCNQVSRLKYQSLYNQSVYNQVLIMSLPTDVRLCTYTFIDVECR